MHVFFLYTFWPWTLTQGYMLIIQHYLPWYKIFPNCMVLPKGVFCGRIIYLCFEFIILLKENYVIFLCNTNISVLHVKWNSYHFLILTPFSQCFSLFFSHKMHFLFFLIQLKKYFVNFFNLLSICKNCILFLILQWIQILSFFKQNIVDYFVIYSNCWFCVDHLRKAPYLTKK